MTLRKKRRLLGGCIALLALLAVAVMLIGTVWIKIVLVDPPQAPAAMGTAPQGTEKRHITH